MAFTPAFFSAQGRSWRIAYLAVLLLPWMLIFERAAADTLTILIGVLFLWQSWRMRDWQWARDPVVRIGLVMWIWGIAISPFAIDIKASFGIALPWIRYLLLYAALRNWVLVKRQALAGLGLMLAAMLSFTIVDSLWQYVTGVSLTGHQRYFLGRLSGPMDNIKVGIFIAKLLLPAAGICFYAALPKKLPVLLSVALLLAGIATIILSGERTASASILLGVVSIVLLLAFAEQKLRRWGIAAMLVLVVGFGALYATQGFVRYRVSYLETNLQGFRQSSYGSLVFIGAEIGKKYWLTGAGFKGFRLACPAYEKAGAGTFCSEHPHNPYVEWFAETGIIGLLWFIMLVGVLLRSGWREFSAQRGVARLPGALAIGTAILHFFPLMATQSMLSNWPAILLWYSLAVAFAALNFTRDGPACG